MRHSLTCDQDKEMAKHAELAAQTGVKVYFCDPRNCRLTALRSRNDCWNSGGTCSRRAARLQAKAAEPLRRR